MSGSEKRRWLFWRHVLSWVVLFVLTVGGNYFLAGSFGHELSWRAALSQGAFYAFVFQGVFYATTMTAYFIWSEKRRSKEPL